MKLKLLLIVLVLGLFLSVHSIQDKSFLGPEFSIIQKVYDDCQDKNDFTVCLKEKALSAITKALEHDTIKITDGIILERQNITEKESIVNKFADARTLNSFTSLDKNLLEKVDKFLRTHLLKFDMNSNNNVEESRKDEKKKDNGIKYVVAALLTAMGIAGPIGLKALAAIAGKALVISKVALTIAGIIALKKLFAHEHHEEASIQVHAGGDHNRRNTYVVRPVKPSGTADPYRYYYEYPVQ